MYIHIYTSIYMYVHTLTNTSLCVYIYTLTNTSLYIYINSQVQVCIYKYTNLYLWVYVHICTYSCIYIKVKVKWSRYRPGVSQRVGRGIALLFYDRGTRKGWVVSSTPRPHFTPGINPVPIVQEAGWAPGPVWTGGKTRPHRDSIPDCPAHSQSLYRLSYPAHIYIYIYIYICRCYYTSKYIYERRKSKIFIWD